jgi:hypothetical protein
MDISGKGEKLEKLGGEQQVLRRDQERIAVSEVEKAGQKSGKVKLKKTSSPRMAPI